MANDNLEKNIMRAITGGSFDYTPSEVQESLGTQEAKIAPLGGISGQEDVTSVDVTPEGAETIVSKVDIEGERIENTQMSMEDMKMQMQGIFAEPFAELEVDPIQFVEWHEELFEQSGVIHPAVPLMYSQDTEDHAVAIKAVANQKAGLMLEHGMTPKERAILNNEPTISGPRVDFRSTAQKAKETGLALARFAMSNPMEQANMSYNLMRNLEIGKFWNLDYGLTNFKNKKGQPMFVGEIQDNKGGY